MARRMWNVLVQGEQHTVEVDLHFLTDAFEVLVDGKVVKAFSGRTSVPGFTRERRTAHFITRNAEHSQRSVIEFEVAGKPAILRHTFLSYELFVDGQKVR